MTKRCWCCGEILETDEFNRNRTRPDGRSSTCKVCHRRICAEWYARNRSTARQRAQEGRARRRDQSFAKLRAYLAAHPCVDCGEADPTVLGLDHRDPSRKEIEVSTLLSAGYSWSRILEELGRCEVRCANCHQRRTAKQFDWPRAR